MKHVSQAVKVGVLFVVMVIGSYGVWKTVGQSASGASDYRVWAHFRDASGLPEGSRVVIAGLPVGEIQTLAIDGRYARVTMRLRDGVTLYDDAVAMKKSSSLLGDYYVEVDPGTPFHQGTDGLRVEHALLSDGGEVRRVQEATTPDALMRHIDEALPKVNELLTSTTQLADDVRGLVNGPIKNIADRIERLVLDESETISRVLDRLDHSLANMERITQDIRNITDDADERVNGILDDVHLLVTETRGTVASAREEITQTGDKVRQKLDLVDEVLHRSSSIATKIDEDQGTLGRLVNDPAIADNIEEITDDVKGFTNTIFGMQTLVGLRSEYFIKTGGANNYVSVELHTRPDKYYLIEFNRGPRGQFPETDIVYDPVRSDAGDYQRRVTIRDGTRVTFMFAKRIDWLTLRFGIKESAGGVGVDGNFFDERLKLSVDVFDSSYNSLPRLKVAAAFELFSHLYVLGGIDDALNDHVVLRFEGAELPSFGLPDVLEEVHFGRDWFVGAMIQFNDLDLTSLLAIGSSVMMSAAQ